jgi:hypothetical protein
MQIREIDIERTPRCVNPKLDQLAAGSTWSII